MGPQPSFGIPQLDDMSARKVLQKIAPLAPRHYVVMEVKGNLLKDDRAQLLGKFAHPWFRRVAKVAIGEPSDNYKSRIYGELLKAKKVKVVEEWKKKKLEFERKMVIKKKQKEQVAKQKQLAAAKKKRELEIKRKAEEEAKKGREEEAKRKAEEEEMARLKAEEEARNKEKEEKDKAAEEGADGGAEKKDAGEDVKAEDAEEKKDEEDEEFMEPEPTSVQLTDEEKKQWFKKQEGTNDLANATFLANFGKFSIPDKDEGFTEVSFE